ncbi:MAG TPA: hypothetical protein VK530_18330 [Candidatus Acidoferrum sp.]|nr:hypothetical protein [Candidatus Acidoferrum sp.]
MQFSRISSRLRRDAVVLVAFAAVAGFYLLGQALSHVLPLNALRAPFLTVVRGLEWRHVLSTDFLVEALVLLPAAVLMFFYTLSTSRRVRITCALTGWLLPLVVLPEIGRWLMAIPHAFRLTYDALAGRGGGQFYGDGPMFFAAVGWWLLLCSVLTLKEVVFRSKNGTNA